MMRIAVVSDIHGNLTAFEAVLEDLRQAAPDLIFHGGDLAASGSSPQEVVDRIRALGWPGVLGNTDEMLFSPEKLRLFAEQSPRFQPLFPVVEEMAAATRAELGEERLAWLRDLPPVQITEGLALVHAKPGDLWRAPAPEDTDEELESAYRPLGRPVAVYGHIHRSFVRRTLQMTVANSGSVSLSYDGDPRAAYLVMDEWGISVRRVAYDVARELDLLRLCGLPHADWIARTIQSGSAQMP
jgi:predicted phosphodiesterase